MPFTISRETFHTYYKVLGNRPDRTIRRLVAIHGGSVLWHDYLVPVADLATKRPVILYDQIGSGRSSLAASPSQAFWTFELFIEEIANVLRYFGILHDFDALGHSWGGVLLCEFIFHHAPKGLKHAILTNSYPSAESFANSPI